MKKYPCISQHSEEDCGAACLASIAKYYGLTLTMGHIRKIVGTGQQGTTLLGLKRGAEELGFNTRSVQTSPEILDKLAQIPLPMIIHWQGNHWVVFYGQRGKKYVVADPGVGLRYLSRQELLQGWMNGVMLLLEPDNQRFFAQADNSPQSKGLFWFLCGRKQNRDNFPET